MMILNWPEDGSKVNNVTKTKPLFIHLPKTAGTFLIQYFKGAGGVTNYLHKRAHTIISPEEWFKFAFVRNPYDWHVSRYFYFCRQDTLENGVSIGCDSGLDNTAFKAKFPTFKEYITWGEKTCKNSFWMSFRYRDMCYVCDKLALDYVGKFEDINKSIKEIYSKCNIEPEISYDDFKKDKTNDKFINRTEHKHYSYYYDNEIRDIVAKQEEMILNDYNYKFEQ